MSPDEFAADQSFARGMKRLTADSRLNTHVASELRRTLDVGLEQIDLDLDSHIRGALIDYVSLLHKWNRTYNLTGVRDPTQMVYRHLLDCLVVAPYICGSRVLDIGTGPGLPGMVLSLACPGIRSVLLDSNGKKTRFCVQAVADLGLLNVQVVHSRIEDYKPEMTYTTVIARAFGKIAKLHRETHRLLAPAGCLVAMKARHPAAELEELGSLGEDARIVPLTVPGVYGERHLVMLPSPGA